MNKLLYWCTLGNHPKMGGFSQNLGFLPFSAEDVVGCCYFEYKPEHLIGLPTAKEWDQLHVLILKAPIPVVEQALADLRPRVVSGEVVVIDVDAQEPPHR